MRAHISPLPEFREGGWITEEQFGRLGKAYMAAVTQTVETEAIEDQYRSMARQASAARTHYENLLEECNGQLTIDMEDG